MSGAPAVTVVVQARTGSTRLPGKVLLDLGGAPMLDLMLRRLAPLSDRAEVVVATSDGPGDDPVADLAARGRPVVRGSELDVLGRVAAALDVHPAPTVVRLTADCPLTDPALVTAAVDLHLASGADYTSNTLVRTFPDGLDVEVLSSDALRAAAAEAVDGPEREHVTPFVQRHPERFAISQLTTPERLGDERWTVDTAEDIDHLRAVVGALADPERATWHDVLAVTGRMAPHGGVRLEPDLDRGHRRGDPYVRSWAVVDDGQPAGRAEVAVGPGGVGRLTIDVDGPLRDAAGAAVRRALAADAQVARLAPDGEQTGHR